MGTIHFGPAEGWNFSPAIRRGMKEADSFILEIDLRDATEEAVSTKHVILPTRVTLDDVVSPETAELLKEKAALLGKLGMPALVRRHLKPWFLSVGAVEAVSKRSGYSGAHSVERSIVAAIGDRPLVGLETFERQLSILDDLSPEHQDMMLQDTLSRLDELMEEIDALMVAWARNDEEGLLLIARQGVAEPLKPGDFYDILLAERNRKWALHLGRILEDPERAGDTIFVGVGALHLVGPDGLIRMLEAAGYRAEPLHPNSGPSS